MPTELLKVGDTTRTGHTVSEILGQSPVAVVYISSNNELRWVYYANHGQLPHELAFVVARFDSLMADIRAIKGTSDEKKTLYTLLGKNLFLALNSTGVLDVSIAFAEAERHILLAKKFKAPSPTSSVGEFDVAIVCALHDPELSAVRLLKKSTEGPLLPGDPQTYYSTTWTTKKKRQLRIVLAAPNHMGLTASGVLAAKMILQFQPRLVAMAGIAAGTKSHKQGFGDILAPEQTFDYGSGKSIDVGRKTTVLPNPNPLSLSPKVLGRLKAWQSMRRGLSEIEKSWPSNKPKTRLEIHTGPMFSSPTVLQTSGPIKAVMSQWRKLIGVEMEAYAVHRACNDTIDPAPVFLCAKSICDFAQDKSDDWQHYAAFTSARFLHEFITSEWETLF